MTKPLLDTTNMTWTHQRSSPTSRHKSVKMTYWINTLFSSRAAVGRELRSQELTFNSQASSCTEMLNEGRRPELGGCLAWQKSSICSLKSWIVLQHQTHFEKLPGCLWSKCAWTWPQITSVSPWYKNCPDCQWYINKNCLSVLNLWQLNDFQFAWFLRYVNASNSMT